MAQEVLTPDIVKQTTVTVLRRMWDFRRQYDQKRATFYRQYVGQRDPQKFPDNITNRSNTFVPYSLSNVETIVSRVMDAFFSFEPWFEATGVTAADDESSEAMSLVLQKKLEDAGFKEAFENLVRNILIYGHSGIKVDWNWDTKNLTKPVVQYATNHSTGQPLLDPQTGQPIPIGVSPQTFTVGVARPRISAIDVYDLMIDPDGGILAQLTERTIIEMLRENAQVYQRTGQYLYYPEVLDRIKQQIMSGHPNDWETVIIRFAEVWDKYQGTCTVITFGDDKDAIAWKDLRASYRAASYSPYKRKVYEGRELLWTGENPFDHKRNPILHTSYIKLPNELYGLGAIEITSDLNESINKFVNMITDNWNLGINRRFAYDTNADIDHDALNLLNVPGGKVAVNGNPNDVLAPLPFFTPNAGDYQILDIYKSMIESTSGVSDFYNKASGSSGGNDTATGISSVINESNFRFKMFIRNLEVDILQPLLQMCASMIQQFMTDQEEVQITKSQQGPEIPKWQVIEPAAIIGNYEFNLVAANYATSKTVRQRNLMAFANIAMQSPYWNQGEGLREIGKLLEIRNISELLKSDQEVQMEQQQQMENQQQMLLLQHSVETEAKVHVNTEKEKAKGMYDPKEGQPHIPKGPKPKPHHQRGQRGATPPPPPRKINDEGGRPPTKNLEGVVPGAGLTSPVRIEAQNNGANAMGMEGLGEVPQNIG